VSRQFEPVRRESTASFIARQLREAIMDHTLGPGDQLSEAALSEQFGVSRGPLREAMQRLVQEGLVRSEPNRGLFVKQLDESDIRDVYAARGAVEGTAAAMVVRSEDPATVKRLRAACQAMTRAAATGDAAALSDADFRFHEVLVTCSGSERLARMHRTLIVETRMCLTALQRTYRNPTELVEEHVRIVDAIEAGDLPLTLRRVEEHMEEALLRLVSPPVQTTGA